MIQEFSLNSVWYLIQATRWTVLLSVVAMIGGALLGAALTVLGLARSRAIANLVSGYIQVVEGIPLLMILFLCYFGVGAAGYTVDPWVSAALGLTVWASTFLAEIWLGSIRSVAPGQWEAASSLALSRSKALRLIIVPQALRIAIPPTVGFLVQLIKGTALTSIIGFVELTRSGQILNNLTFRPFTIYLIVGCIYFALCWPLSVSSKRLERRLSIPVGR